MAVPLSASVVDGAQPIRVISASPTPTKEYLLKDCPSQRDCGRRSSHRPGVREVRPETNLRPAQSDRNMDIDVPAPTALIDIVNTGPRR